MNDIDRWYASATVRRDRTKVAMDEAAAAWNAAGRPVRSPELLLVNETQSDYEHAVRDYERARVHWRKAHEVVIEQTDGYIVVAEVV